MLAVGMLEVRLLGGAGSEACYDYRKSLRNAIKTGNILEALLSLEGYAWALNSTTQRLEAARLLGATAEFRERIGAPVFPQNQQMYDRVISELKNELEEEDFVLAWAEGRAMEIESAIALVLG